MRWTPCSYGCCVNDYFRRIRQLLLKERLVLFLKKSLFLKFHLIGTLLNISAIISIHHLLMIPFLTYQAIWDRKLKKAKELVPF